MTSTTVFTANAHDNGYDLVPGHDVTSPRIGRVYWESAGIPDAGLVIALDGDDAEHPDETTPDSAMDAAVWLAMRGYTLDADSERAIAGLMTV